MSLVGKQVGPYKVLALVGQGAMAVVYRAEHAGLGREVALKVPHAAAREHEDVARFRREGRLLASIQHPGVIQILDADEIDDIAFLAMTFVSAPTLEQVLAACPDGRLTETRVINVARSLLEALGAIHEKGILHRDLKPSNVFVETEDRTILADFGVARPLGEHTMITADGAAVGTFLYMAPEQHTEEKVDARTDLYMLGLLMYRALCGKLPFHGNMVQIMSAKCEESHLASPRSLVPEVSLGMEAVLRRACARRPEERFQSAAEFRTALTALKSRPITTAANSRPRDLARQSGGVTNQMPRELKRTARRSRQRTVAALVGVAFALGALVAVLAFRGGASTPVVWVALPDESPHASASASAPPRLRARPRNAPLDLAESQETMRALWPGYVTLPLEVELAGFGLKAAAGAQREPAARDLLKRLGSMLPEETMRDLAERSLIYPDFYPFMVPNGKLPRLDRRRFMPNGTSGILDEPIYEFVGKSTPQTALAMFLSGVARSVDHIAELRTSGRPTRGVTMVDLLTLVGYLTMSQPGFHAGTGEQVYALFSPTNEEERLTFDTGDTKLVTARARQVDALCVTHYHVHPTQAPPVVAPSAR